MAKTCLLTSLHTQLDIRRADKRVQMYLSHQHSDVVVLINDRYAIFATKAVVVIYPLSRIVFHSKFA
jgi:hypothetical protein